MKKTFLTILVLVSSLGQAQVGIGTTSPDASSILDLSSTNKGLLLPRLTTSQRDAVATPIAGLMIFNTTTNKINIFVGAGWDEMNTTATYGSIATIDCAGATNAGTMNLGTEASGVTSTISYTGGNGLAHNGQVVTSTGVTGLTATLTAGSFASGNGTLVYTITGTPATGGTANFALSIGGQSCALQIDVSFWPAAGYVHCGIPTAVVEVVSTVTGRIWMDRNLGATQLATSATDAAAYGDLYQWGRGADGHQCRTPLTTTTTLSSTDQVGNSNFILSSGHVGNNIAPFLDWRSPQNNTLWQGDNGTNNPCPSGFRLPTMTEFNAEFAGITTNFITAAYQSSLKLTIGGQRLSAINQAGGLGFVGSRSAYWTSNTSSGVSSSYMLYTDAVRTFDSSAGRSAGASVRCIKN